MGKKKSAVCLIFVTLIIAALIVVCFASFPCGELNYYNSLLSLTQKDAQLGGYLIGETGYLGGGYEIVYLPEGVISSKEYEETAAYKEGSELKKYEDSYLKHGAVYLERETVLEKNTDKVSSAFEQSFKNTVSVLKDRFERIHSDGMSLRVADDYSVRIFLPATLSAASVAFQYFAYTGNLTVRYGSSEEAATTIMPAQKGEKHAIDYYVKGAYTRSAGNSYYVAIDFTNAGREILASATADSTDTVYFFVGDKNVINLSVSEKLDQDTLYISSENYTADTSNIVATLLDSSVVNEDADVVKLGTESIVMRSHAAFGDTALTLIYIALAVCIALSLVYFFVRNRLLAFSHLYSLLSFAVLMVICVWALPTVSIGVGTVLAFALTGVLLSVSNALSFAAARKVYSHGASLEHSVKQGYQNVMWSIFDIHVVLLIVSLITYFIAFAELQMFALVFALGVAFSGLCSLLLNRFYWYIMLPLAKNKARFCHFIREEEAEDDD